MPKQTAVSRESCVDCGKWLGVTTKGTKARVVKEMLADLAKFYAEWNAPGNRPVVGDLSVGERLSRLGYWGLLTGNLTSAIAQLGRICFVCVHRRVGNFGECQCGYPTTQKIHTGGKWCPKPEAALPAPKEAADGEAKSD